MSRTSNGKQLGQYFANEPRASLLDPRLQSSSSYVPFTSIAMDDTTIGACQCALIDFFQDEAAPSSTLDDRSGCTESMGTASSNAQFLVSWNKTGRDSFGPRLGTSRHTVNLISALNMVAQNMTEHAEADKYVEAYLSHINPDFPVLDPEQAVDISDPNFSALASAALVAGAHVVCPQDIQDDNMRGLYRNAKATFDARMDESEPREALVQAALLLSWQPDSRGTSHVHMAWYWLNMAKTLAMELGMHRNAERSSADAHTKSRWRRLWWLMFRSQVQICFQLGRPQIIDLDDCDVLMLSPEELDGCMDGTQAEIFLCSIRLSIAQSKIQKTFFRPTLSLSARLEARMQAGAGLAEWRLQVPSSLFRDEDTSCSSGLGMLWLSYLSTILLLYRPESKEKRLKTTWTAVDAVVCKTAASRIVALLMDLRESGQLKFMPQYTVHIAFSALIELYVETLLPATDNLGHAQGLLDSLRSSMTALSGFWPETKTILDRFDASAPILAGQKDTVKAEIEELHTTASAPSIGHESESQADEMDFESTPRECSEQYAESSDPERTLTLLFGEGWRDQVDFSSPAHEWKHWRQFYWRWSHIRCV